MTDILTPQPAVELVAELSRRIQAMWGEMQADIEREDERFRQYRHDRHRRFQDETRHMTAQRDALLKIVADTEAAKPICWPPHGEL
jgi:hypothetical protein